jgi:hypothetical protein
MIDLRLGQTGRNGEIMTTKRERVMANYEGFKGNATVDHIERNIKTAWPDAYTDLTGVKYGKLMTVANASYHDGRNNTGADCKEGLIVAGDVIIPLEIARRITTTIETVTSYRSANDDGKDNLAYRGGDSTYYQVVDGKYKPIDCRTTADKLSRDHVPIFWQDRDNVTVVMYNGQEIDRVNGIV